MAYCLFWLILHCLLSIFGLTFTTMSRQKKRGKKKKRELKQRHVFVILPWLKAGATEMKKGKTIRSKVLCGFHWPVFSSPPQDHWQYRTGLQIMLQMKVKYSCRNSLSKKNTGGKGTAGDEGYFPISLFFYQGHWNTSTTNTSSVMPPPQRCQ